jgi:N-methylhydantoinase A
MGSSSATGLLGVDVGGTFTDLVSVVDGVIEVTKVPSDRQQPEGPVIEGVRFLGAENKSAFNHASTVGLNSVITRRLPKVAFLTTHGHRDILDFGRSFRPLEAQTDPHWRRSFGDASRPLVERYLRRGIRERKTVTGGTLIPLDEEQARHELEILARCNVEGVAICLLHSYLDGSHERRLRELVFEALGDDVACSISSEVSPLAKEYARASTTVIDTCMKVIYGAYSTRLQDGLRDAGFEGALNFADSAANLMASEFALEHPYRLVFSGPSAGTMSCAHLGARIGEPNLLCCDVGGTSADISVVTDGAPFLNTTFELEHDMLINSLSNDVVSLGAGGGSIIGVNLAGEITVGPESAGAEPGPACYGRGGTSPTITDACLLAGILNPNGFLGGDMTLDVDAARAAFARIDTPFQLGEFVGNAYRMALNHISEGVVDAAIRRGSDPRDYVLVAYGAAGPMLLPALLDLVRAKCVIVPPHPGLFSALGLLSSEVVYSDSRSEYLTLEAESGVAGRLDEIYTAMEQSLLEKLPDEADVVTTVRTLDACLLGQTWDTPFVPVPAGRITDEQIPEIIEAFHRQYAARYGNRFDAIAVRGITYRVQVVLPTNKVEYPPLAEADGRPPVRTGTVRLRYVTAREVEADEYQRLQLLAGQVIDGPAIVREPLSTTYVTEGQRATVGPLGELQIHRRERP